MLHKVLTVFSAPAWCAPCRALHTTIEDNELNIDIQFIDVDESPEAAKEYGIRSVPTLILFVNGEEAKRTTGNLSLEALKIFIS